MRPPTLLTVDHDETEPSHSDVMEVKDFIKNEERRKREEEMQGDQYRDNFIANDPRTSTSAPRGDIPSNAVESCDGRYNSVCDRYIDSIVLSSYYNVVFSDEVIRQLTLLRQTIELLRREVGDQKGTIEDLRKRLAQCCNKIPAPPPVERCTSGSCYPGY